MTANEDAINNLIGINLPQMGIQRDVYCMQVIEINNNRNLDKFLVGTDVGLYHFTYNDVTSSTITALNNLVPNPNNSGIPYHVTSIQQYSSNHYYVVIHGQGIYDYNSSSNTWATGANLVTSIFARNNSNNIIYDVTTNSTVPNYTQLHFIRNNTNDITGYLLMNERPTVAYGSPANVYVGILYSPAASFNGPPTGIFTALTVDASDPANEFGWNTTRPHANINSSCMVQGTLNRNYLIVGKNGNIFASKADVQGAAVNWQQIYTEIVTNACGTDVAYGNRGFVNTASQSIFHIGTELYYSERDRLMSFSNLPGFTAMLDVTNTTLCRNIAFIPAVSGCGNTSANLALTDCFSITNNTFPLSNDLNLYAGAAEGPGEQMGRGTIIMLPAGTTSWTNAVTNTVCGDPIKILFSSGNDMYALVTTIAGPRELFHFTLGGTLNLCTVGSITSIRDVVLSPDGNTMFAIPFASNDNVIQLTKSSATAWSPVGAPLDLNGNTANADVIAEELITYNYDLGYKVLLACSPRNANTHSKLVEVYNSDVGALVPIEINNDCNGNVPADDIFIDLFDGDQNDRGITALAVAENIRTIYVAATQNEGTGPRARVYKGIYDINTGTIEPCWTDITGNMPNKTVQCMGTNGSDCDNEFLYACVRGMGEWRWQVTPFTTTSGTVQNEFLRLTNDLNLAGQLILENCTLSVSQGVSIICGQGDVLKLTNCYIYACGDMWQGIINNGGTVIIENSTIEDAILATRADGNGSKVQLSNVTFDHNFGGVSLNNGDYFYSYIRGCTFDCNDGQITKAPHVAELTDNHVVLNNVARFTLGVNILPQNIFRNAVTAVLTNQSNIIIQNNLFDWQKLYNFNSTHDAQAISLNGSYSNINLSPHTHTIGGLSNGNTFINWQKNIFARGCINLNIENNIINMGQFDRSNEGVQESACKNIIIQNNAINRCKQGVQMFNNVTAVATVHANSFNKYFQLEEDFYDDEAIRCEYVLFDTYTPYTITDNEIFNVAIGIHIRNVNTTVNNNQYTTELSAFFIDFYYNNHNAGSVSPHIGVWAENCNGATIFQNHATWTSAITVQEERDMIQGIRLQSSLSCRLQENTMTNMGAGIDVFDDCSNSSLLCNEMENCWNGVYLDDASPTSFLSTQGIFGATQATSTTWDNKWINNIGGFKIDGATWLQQNITWIYDPALSSEYDPDPSAGFVTRQPGDLHNCYTPPPINDGERARIFGSAVGDSTATDGYDSLEFVIIDKEKFFKSATTNPAILALGTNNDAKYIAEYDSLK
ncbi:MAG TPA: hypothetical protein PK736_02725 [Bacteroidia bacterium]|nr:hypothetical protein [Bacteroidia bacterium]